jgi:NAD(P)-dependent dehydrogenase (short-subunit alcohol dehydrogenase family)
MEGDGFDARYGPWAVIAGASDGVGAALARAVAAHVALIARRQAVLDDVAASIRAQSGVEARAVADGPTWFVGDLVRDGARHLRAMPRGDAVRLMIEMGGGVMGAGQEADE